MTMRARANVKIEIGESLIFSWLRHVQGCPIAQTRWKPSSTWAIRNEPALARDFEAMRDIAGQRLGFGVFKKSSFQQFIRQAEIDVLGLRFSDDGTAAIAVDSAFHENGVQYGDLKETVGRILKKMIRAAFALEAYFRPASSGHHFRDAEDAQRRWGCSPGVLAGPGGNSGRLPWSVSGTTAPAHCDQRRLRRADHSASARSDGRSR
jgi:hypothetical protein